jgi:hypothetical protein
MQAIFSLEVEEKPLYRTTPADCVIDCFLGSASPLGYRLVVAVCAIMRFNQSTKNFLDSQIKKRTTG